MGLRVILGYPVWEILRVATQLSLGLGLGDDLLLEGSRDQFSCPQYEESDSEAIADGTTLI